MSSDQTSSRPQGRTLGVTVPPPRRSRGRRPSGRPRLRVHLAGAGLRRPARLGGRPRGTHPSRDGPEGADPRRARGGGRHALGASTAGRRREGVLLRPAGRGAVPRDRGLAPGLAELVAQPLLRPRPRPKGGPPRCQRGDGRGLRGRAASPCAPEAARRGDRGGAGRRRPVDPRPALQRGGSAGRVLPGLRAGGARAGEDPAGPAGDRADGRAVGCAARFRQALLRSPRSCGGFSACCTHAGSRARRSAKGRRAARAGSTCRSIRRPPPGVTPTFGSG